MNIKIQKKLAAKVAKVSPKRIKIDEVRVEEVKEAITRRDISELIKDRTIIIKPKKGISRVRANKRQKQRAKGRQKGVGKKKGSPTSRLPKKKSWMAKIRVQRAFLSELKSKELLKEGSYRGLWLKAKGGFFRNKRHIKLYLEEHSLFNKKK